MTVINSITKENITTRKAEINQRGVSWSSLIAANSAAEMTTEAASIANNIMLDAVLKNQQEIMSKLGIGEKFTATA